MQYLFVLKHGFLKVVRSRFKRDLRPPSKLTLENREKTGVVQYELMALMVE